MTIAQTIQAHRGKVRLSQEQLAEQIGVSRQAVSKWETGEAIPDTDKLVPLARALHISVDELLGNLPPAADETTSREKTPPGWLATHWYWIGAVVAVWGGVRLIQKLFVLLPVLGVLF